MPTRILLEKVAGDADLRDAHDLMCQAFESPNWTRDGIERWLTDMGRDAVRIVRCDGSPAATLGVLNWAHWFGGQRVSACGVSVVAVAAHQRGRGLAEAMMRAALQEQRAAGAAISTLYPSNLPLYRKVGYELAGLRNRFVVHLAQLGAPVRDRLVRPMTDADLPGVRDVHDEFGRTHSGLVSRGDGEWRRLLKPSDKPPRAFVVEGADGRPAGHLLMTVGSHQGEACLLVSDFAYADAAAGRALLTLLGDHRSTLSRAIVIGGGLDALTPLAPNAIPESAGHGLWMLRILDLRQAIAERGFPAGLTAQVELDVTDDLFPDNAGRFLLQVSGGRGAIERFREATGAAAVQTDVRTLAAVYSGFWSARQAVLTGGLVGQHEALANLDAIFAGPTPWLNERF